MAKPVDHLLHHAGTACLPSRRPLQDLYRKLPTARLLIASLCQSTRAQGSGEGGREGGRDLDLDLYLDLGAYLRAHRTPGVEHGGVPDDSA